MIYQQVNGMTYAYVEEGDKCPECRLGILQWAEVKNCSCHICPPCSACTDNILECPVCGWEEEALERGIKEFIKEREFELI